MSECTKIRVAKCGHDYDVPVCTKAGRRRLVGNCDCIRPAKIPQRRMPKQPTVRKVISGECRRCGAFFCAGAQGSQQIYCGRECRYAGQIERKVAAEKELARERRESGHFRCKWDDCGVVLQSANKWCDEHRRQIRRDQPKDNLALKCSADECSRPVRALGVCNMHYKRILKAEGRIKEQPWNDRRRNNHHGRRARLARAESEDFTLDQIIARDGRDCGICSEPIDAGLKYPDPFSQSLDHIVPIARGGGHTLSNCQLAHLRCNLSKGARVA